MKEQQSIQENASSQDHAETYQGLSLAPPQFKLSAGAADAGPGKNLALGAEVDGAASANAYTERVANFGRLGEEVQAAANSGDQSRLIVVLESLKHDLSEINQFKAYFQGKYGVGLDDFLRAAFAGSGIDIQPLLNNLVADMSKISPSNVAHLVAESIAENDPDSVMGLLMTCGKSSQVANAYTEAYPGHDLRVDLQGMAAENAALGTFLGNFFGDTQNYEGVKVNNEQEAVEARSIIARIYDHYAVDVNSQKTLDLFRNSYPDAPDSLKAQLKTRNWTLPELRDLEFGLSKFAPIAGEKRSHSSRRGAEQEVQTAGRINSRIERNPKGQYSVAKGVQGSYSAGQDAFALMDGDRSLKNSGKTTGSGSGQHEVQDGARMVITHELGHGFLEYAVGDWKSQIPYWAKRSKRPSSEWQTVLMPDGEKIAAFMVHSAQEIPPTMYAMKAPHEDLADSLALFMNNPSVLRDGTEEYRKVRGFTDLTTKTMVGAPCPARYSFISRKIREWQTR